MDKMPCLIPNCRRLTDKFTDMIISALLPIQSCNLGSEVMMF